MSDAGRMPVLFVGHGNPMNAIADNKWSQSWKQLGRKIPRPKAVVCISAHWYLPGSFVTSNHDPRTIHDFGGFPRELYEVQYPAPGDPGLASRVAARLTECNSQLRSDWGLDHGTWSVLRHLIPDADVPTIQLSIDSRATHAQHLDIASKLAPLRDQGVLVLGSGNLVHNLRSAFQKMRINDQTVPPWAKKFDQAAAHALSQHDNEFLEHALEDEEGQICHPSPDHYLPILYAAGAADTSDSVTFPADGFDLGLSMRVARFG